MPSYNPITSNKDISIDSDKKTNVHIGTIYAGLLNDTTNSVIGNLKDRVINTSVSNSWITVKLEDLDSTYTAYKVICDVSANNTENARTVIIKLNYNSKESPYTLKITQAAKTITEPREKGKITITWQTLNIEYIILASGTSDSRFIPFTHDVLYNSHMQELISGTSVKYLNTGDKKIEIEYTAGTNLHGVVDLRNVLRTDIITACQIGSDWINWDNVEQNITTNSFSSTYEGNISLTAYGISESYKSENKQLIFAPSTSFTLNSLLLQDVVINLETIM